MSQFGGFPNEKTGSYGHEKDLLAFSSFFCDGRENGLLCLIVIEDVAVSRVSSRKKNLCFLFPLP